MSKVLTPILFTIIAIGLFFSYLKPAYSELQASKERQVKLEQVIKESEDLIKKYDALKAKKNAISTEDMKNLFKILPDSIDPVRMILDLDALATKYNLTILSFKVPELESEVSALQNSGSSRNARNSTSNIEDKESPVKSAVLTIECEGDYADFKKLLLEIENNLSLMDVVELGVVVAEEIDADASAEPVYTLGLQSYWLKEIK